MTAIPDDVKTSLPSAMVADLERYLSFLQHERGYSKHTLATYLRPLLSLAVQLHRDSISHWSEVSEADLKRWLVSFKKANLKPSSIQNKVSSCKGLFRFLLQKGVITTDPSELVSAPKSGRALPKNMSVDELSGLLSFEPESPIEFRDKAIMELFYSSGLRLSELAGLNISSLNLSDREVRVLGKGNRERIVPLGQLALQAINDWLKHRVLFETERTDTQTAPLFLSKLGNRLSTRQIDQRLKHWAQKQGLKGTLHPHKLRHSFASHVLESSGDLRAVQELLGHQNLSTTQIYTHLDYQHLASVYDKAHPRAKKNK
ncbi:tyrosine recombinase XerC [Psychrosphaera ytuae]|nr:tyrosine recombinase XerC [Psychrosphaera ytuae]